MTRNFRLTLADCMVYLRANQTDNQQMIVVKEAGEKQIDKIKLLEKRIEQI